MARERVRNSSTAGPSPPSAGRPDATPVRCSARACCGWSPGSSCPGPWPDLGDQVADLAHLFDGVQNQQEAGPRTSAGREASAGGVQQRAGCGVQRLSSSGAQIRRMARSPRCGPDRQRHKTTGRVGRRATSRTSRVLPTPPSPVTVTRARTSTIAVSRAISGSRPISAVSGAASVSGAGAGSGCRPARVRTTRRCRRPRRSARAVTVRSDIRGRRGSWSCRPSWCSETPVPAVAQETLPAPTERDYEANAHSTTNE